MDVLDRDKILAAKDIEIKTVPTPEWGGVTAVRSFSGATRARLLSGDKDGAMPTDWMERVIVAAACHADGSPLFDDSDIDALSKKSARVLERVFIAAADLNGLTADTVEKKKETSPPTPK